MPQPSFLFRLCRGASSFFTLGAIFHHDVRGALILAGVRVLFYVVPRIRGGLSA
jgi:hypothetical protein